MFRKECQDPPGSFRLPDGHEGGRRIFSRKQNKATKYKCRSVLRVPAFGTQTRSPPQRPPRVHPFSSRARAWWVLTHQGEMDARGSRAGLTPGWGGRGMCDQKAQGGRVFGDTGSFPGTAGEVPTEPGRAWGLHTVHGGRSHAFQKERATAAATGKTSDARGALADVGAVSAAVVPSAAV